MLDLDMDIVESGLKAGGVLWFLSGLAIFIPLWFKLALPLWGRPGRLGEFTLRSLVVLASATLPGGTLIAGALVIRAVTTESEFAPAELPAEAEAS